MIATILPGSTDFHAVRYNERKVSKGMAHLIEMKDFGPLGSGIGYTPDDLVRFLKLYSSRNDRIRKAQFHVAISCKGREMTDEELLDFARRYLTEMGYMNPGQPILIYAHHDTANNHLHIVTTRVTPDGRKIDHNHERRRSQAVIDKLLENNPEEKAGNDIKAAGTYHFGSFAQFKAILSSMGYQVYEKEGTVHVKRGGKVLRHFPLLDVEILYNRKKPQTDRRRNIQLRKILLKYRDVCDSKEELAKELKTKFGIDLIFFGRKDKPFGYMIVDHKNKAVINGARILSTEELLDFATPEERFKRIEDFIDKLFELTPKITQHQIHEKIWKQHAWIKKGVIYYNGQPKPLQKFMADTIDRNNRIFFVEKFKPTTKAEVEMLCKVFKVRETDLVSLSSERTKEYTEAVGRFKELFADKEIKDRLRNELFGEGFILKEVDGSVFAINFKEHLIIDMKAEGFDLKRLKKKPKKSRGEKKLVKNVGRTLGKLKLHDAGGGSGSENREWEVGRGGNHDNVDDGRPVKR